MCTDGVHCRESASAGPGSSPQVSSGRVLPWQVTMDKLICASRSHTHYWYEAGMLKVLACCFVYFQVNNGVWYTRALSLRNLVSRYECRRVFPVGVGPVLPSRDAAKWLPSRFSLSVETRRRYGWLRMVFPGARLVRALIWCPSRGVAARERQRALPSRRVW